jgi:hypothetical protein
MIQNKHIVDWHKEVSSDQSALMPCMMNETANVVRGEGKRPDTKTFISADNTVCWFGGMMKTKLKRN